nr:MAG TPA: hypothetical protein [Caudoviricetes sp.]
MFPDFICFSLYGIYILSSYYFKSFFFFSLTFYINTF